MKSSIILIGPLGAGKSTVGHVLAKKLGVPQCSVDDVRWKYYDEIGYDKVLASNIAKSDQGVQGQLRYSKPFEVYLIERVFNTHTSRIYKKIFVAASKENRILLFRSFNNRRNI